MAELEKQIDGAWSPSLEAVIEYADLVRENSEALAGSTQTKMEEQIVTRSSLQQQLEAKLDELDKKLDDPWCPRALLDEYSDCQKEFKRECDRNRSKSDGDDFSSDKLITIRDAHRMVMIVVDRCVRLDKMIRRVAEECVTIATNLNEKLAEENAFIRQELERLREAVAPMPPPQSSKRWKDRRRSRNSVQ